VVVYVHMKLVGPASNRHILEAPRGAVTPVVHDVVASFAVAVLVKRHLSPVTVCMHAIDDYMTVRFKPLKCTIDVSVHGALGVWSWAALTSRFFARGVRHRDEHLYCNAE